MAISAPTFVFPHQINYRGTQKEVVARFTLDASYPAGGYTVTPNTLGLSEIRAARATVDSPGGSEYIAAYNRSTQKLQLFTSNGAAPAALLENTTADVHTVVVELEVVGV